MGKFEHGFRVVAKAALLVAALLPFSSGSVRADGNPEAGLTQREYRETIRIEPAASETAPAALPVTVHKLNDAEKAEMERMHAVRVVRGRDWKDLTPQERYDRIKNLRDTMTGVSLMLTVPGGDLWAIPPGEGGVNFQDIVKQKLVRFWSEEEIESLAVAVATEDDWHSDIRGEFAVRGPSITP